MKGAVEQGDASVRGGAPWCCIAVHGMVGKKKWVAKLPLRNKD